MSYNNELELSIVLPCLNEEKAILSCFKELRAVLDREQITYEIIVVDNNSTDSSSSLLEGEKNKFSNFYILKEYKQGYGSAYLKGFSQAKAKYIYMADLDSSYDFNDIPKFINKAKTSSVDLVVGNRFSKFLSTKEMPFSHRFIGNPVLSFLVRKLFKVKIKDIHCGARLIKREVLNSLSLCSSGMEFASEMIIKASKKGIKIDEIDINYRPRQGESKLNSLKDGWRHLRFILLYSPKALFLFPGISLFAIGLISLVIFYFFDIEFFGQKFFFHPMLLFTLLIFLGYQLIIFGGFSKIYAINHLDEKDKFTEKVFKKLSLEKAISFGLILFFIGIIIFLYVFVKWLRLDFLSLQDTKNSIIALTLLVLGVQTFFSSFMFSILSIKKN